MIGTFILVNGALAPVSEGAVALDDVDATGGYGCYETLKIRGGVLYFADYHERRLLASAAAVGIEHDLGPGAVAEGLSRLVAANRVADCNLKVMLIGREGRPADWYAFLLPPVFPPASAYKDGVACLLFRGERQFPEAKTLSLLMQTAAYRAARRLGMYDALLVDGLDRVTEGTRTNLFFAKRGQDRPLYTPPKGAVLEGVTRATLIEALAEAGIAVEERYLALDEALSGGYALAVTSTSSRVIQVAGLSGPVSSPRPGEVPVAANLEPSPELSRAASIYDAYLERYAGRIEGLG